MKATVAEHHRPTKHKDAPTLLDGFTDADGMEVRYVHVEDESRNSQTLHERQRWIADADKALRQHLDWKGPEDTPDKEIILHNPVSRAVYNSPAMREWRTKLVPSAKALYPMQRPNSSHLPSGGEVDPLARSFFLDAIDSIGIRTRARIMGSIMEEHALPGEANRWVSLASGAAVPVFDAAARFDVSMNLAIDLVDYDQNALNFAQQLARQQPIEGASIRMHRRNLVKDMIATDSLVQDLGEETIGMVDALGIFEYFDDQRSVLFLKNAYRLVQPGGVMVAANMLSDRPELDFNQRGIGWPKIFPRSRSQLKQLLTRAGVPLDCVTMTIPEDRVYVVAEIKRQQLQASCSKEKRLKRSSLAQRR